MKARKTITFYFELVIRGQALFFFHLTRYISFFLQFCSKKFFIRDTSLYPEIDQNTIRVFINSEIKFGRCVTSEELIVALIVGLRYGSFLEKTLWEGRLGFSSNIS